MPDELRKQSKIFCGCAAGTTGVLIEIFGETLRGLLNFPQCYHQRAVGQGEYNYVVESFDKLISALMVFRTSYQIAYHGAGGEGDNDASADAGADLNRNECVEHAAGTDRPGAGRDRGH